MTNYPWCHQVSATCFSLLERCFTQSTVEVSDKCGETRRSAVADALRIFYVAGTVAALAAAADASGSAGFTAWQRASEEAVDAVSAVISNQLAEGVLVAAAKATDAWAADTGAMAVRAQLTDEQAAVPCAPSGCCSDALGYLQVSMQWELHWLSICCRGRIQIASEQLCGCCCPQTYCSN